MVVKLMSEVCRRPIINYECVVPTAEIFLKMNCTKIVCYRQVHIRLFHKVLKDKHKHTVHTVQYAFCTKYL